MDRKKCLPISNQDRKLGREESSPPNPSPLSPSCQQMFVRLFVDENLDRMVPISKQPKEKIQAIIDSCRRQFPEYQERARKRIRTYLKSCRRMKRSGFEMVSFDLKPSPSFHQNPICKSMTLFCFHLSVFFFIFLFFSRLFIYLFLVIPGQRFLFASFILPEFIPLLHWYKNYLRH